MTLVPQPNLEKLVAVGAISFGELLDTLAEANAEVDTRVQAPSFKPVSISISDEQRTLLRRLATSLAVIELPDSPRELTEAEKREFVQIFADVKSGKDAIVSAESALKEVFARHLDAEAIQEHGDSVETDKYGHVLLPGEVVADGVASKVTRELRGGKANSLTVHDLQALEESGAIDHKTFLAMTEAVPATRRVDEQKIMDLLAKRPELLQTLASVASLSDKQASYYLRKSK